MSASKLFFEGGFAVASVTVRRLMAVAVLLLAAPALTFAQASKAAPKSTAASAPASKEIVKSAGSRSAPITMEVFSDFQCPACRNLYFEVLRPMMNDYVHSGKVYLVHRDNPLAMHPYARDAARMANAAAQVGKFERVVEAIYAAQPAWSVDRSKLDQAVASVLTPAELTQVRAAMTSTAVESSIDRDLAAGRTVPVGSTPTVVLTHRGQRIPLPGSVNYPLLRRVLEQMLAQR